MLQNENLANHTVKCTMQIMHHNTISLAQNRQFFSICYVAVQWPTLGYLYLLKGQPYSPYVNHYVLSILTQQLPETL